MTADTGMTPHTPPTVDARPGNLRSSDVRSTAEAAEVIRAARDAGTRLRIVGSDRWSGEGSPAARVPVNLPTLSTAKLTGVVAYVPADLTLTVRAGTTLAELNTITEPNNQWCPLLSWGDDEGTVGATFATGTAGPCAHALGRPRDIALGVEFVDGTGATIRGGGRVVKNVAGFDLTRLMVGAFGTLGVITEITLRLRAKPQVDISFCVRPTLGPNDPGSAKLAASALLSAEILPIACEPIDARLGAAMGLNPGCVIVRYSGNRALVTAGRVCAEAVGSATEIGSGVWTKLRALDPHPRRLDGSPLETSVARRIKQRFDPSGILNPGLFGESA